MKLSVIIPQSLNDRRAQFDFIESWCQQTGVAPEDYEIVVAVNDRDESAIRRCRELVRPHDRVIAFHGESDTHYYEAGVGASSGRLLFLTENHVAADEHCVANLLAFFERTNARCAFVKAKHINGSRFARHEGETYDRMISTVWLQPECWDRVHARGFAIEREVLASVGGVPWQYGLFFPRLLSLKLFRQSIPIEYCPEAVIHHVNITRLDLLQNDIGSYIRHEFRYRDERHCDDDELELGSNDVLGQRKLWKDNLISKGASALNAAIWNKLTWRSKRSAISWRTLLSTSLRWRSASKFGPKMLLWNAYLHFLWCRLRYAIVQFSPAKGSLAFEALWDAIAGLESARYCIAHPEPPAESAAYSFGAEVRNVIGFHCLEESLGICFRWSEPVALLTLELAQGDHEICIDTGRIRGAECEFRFDLFFNGRQIERSGVDIDEGCIRFSVDSEHVRESAEQELLILTEPLRLRNHHSRERRQLGMPVRSVSCQSLSSTIPIGSQPARDSFQGGRKGLRRTG